MKCYEELESQGIERCEECNNPVADDWKYVDWSNKTIAECPQCGTFVYLDLSTAPAI